MLSDLHEEPWKVPWCHYHDNTGAGQVPSPRGASRTPHTPNPWLLQLAIKSQTTVSAMILWGEPYERKHSICKSLKARPAVATSNARELSRGGAARPPAPPASRKAGPLRGRVYPSSQNTACAPDLESPRVEVAATAAKKGTVTWLQLRECPQGRCRSSGTSETSTCTPILDLTTQSSLFK